MGDCACVQQIVRKSTSGKARLQFCRDAEGLALPTGNFLLFRNVEDYVTYELWCVVALNEQKHCH